MGVFGFLKSVCKRCGGKRGLYKIKDGEWICIECLKAGEYKTSWIDIQNRITRSYKENEVIYQNLMREAEVILKLKIAFDNGEITEEEYNEKAKIFFGD